MTSSFRRWFIVTSSFTVAGIILGLIFSWLVGGALCAPANHPVSSPIDLAVENVAFHSENGSTIKGWLVNSTTNRGVIILQHGIHADKSTLANRAKLFSQAGYAVLLFDFQAHGESIGKRITMGFLESRDSQAAVDFVKKRFPRKPIAVLGVSLGAAAAALANPPLDVQALVLEMPFSTVVEATKDRIELRLSSCARILSPLLTLQIPLRTGCAVDDLRPMISVEKITVPKLFLHGTEDRETKFSEAKDIFAHAAEPKTLVSFLGARHEDFLQFDPIKYKPLVLNFLADHLK